MCHKSKCFLRTSNRILSDTEDLIREVNNTVPQKLQKTQMAIDIISLLDNICINITFFLLFSNFQSKIFILATDKPTLPLHF